MLMIRNLSGLAFNSFDGLYKHSGLLAIVSIAGFVLQLAFLHERDTDADEHNRHRYWSADEPVNAVHGGVHDPYAPPESHLAEVVRVSSAFPQTYVAVLAGVGGTEVVYLLVRNELDGCRCYTYEKTYYTND